jgi:hypothetical protein
MKQSQPLCPNGAGPTSRGHADFEPLVDEVLRCLSCGMLAKRVYPDRPVWVHAHTLDRLTQLENETKEARERFKKFRRGKESTKRRSPPFPDPFEILNLPRDDAKGRYVTGWQRTILKRSGIDGEGLSCEQANRLDAIHNLDAHYRAYAARREGGGNRRGTQAEGGPGRVVSRLMRRKGGS